jgi:hypothetical protein
MSRNLKVLGLALVAVLAMSVMVASAASASQYTASAYPATATGANTSGKETFTTPGGTVQCDSHFQGTLAAASSTLTVTPKYTNCVAFGFLNATVEFKGCDYLFHAGASKGGGVYDNSVDIACPAGSGPITIKAGTCEVHILAQTSLSNLVTVNSGGTITLQWQISLNITILVTKDGFGCPFPGTGHFKASLHGDVTLPRVGGGTISVSGS